MFANLLLVYQLVQIYGFVRIHTYVVPHSMYVLACMYIYTHNTSAPPPKKRGNPAVYPKSVDENGGEKSNFIANACLHLAQTLCSSEQNTETEASCMLHAHVL